MSDRQSEAISSVRTAAEQFLRSKLLWQESEGLWSKIALYFIGGVNRANAKLFHRLVCKNQGEVTQYRYLLSQKHRALKQAVSKKEGRVNNRANDAEAQLALEVVDFAHKGLFAAIQQNFDLLHSYFDGRPGGRPRMCVKGNFGDESAAAVVSIFRDREVGYSSSYDINENSGFLHCAETGKYFLENDLVTAVAEGRYKNPRIQETVAKAVMRSVVVARIATLDVNWTKIWGGAKRNADDCYRSTLIIPMTLWNNNLSEEFVHSFGAGDAERLIFGFLCFDSPHKNYFFPDDVDIGYVVADLLSLFAIDLLTQTKFSVTYNEVINRESFVDSRTDITESFHQGELKNASDLQLRVPTDSETRSIESRRNHLVNWGRIPVKKGKLKKAG